MLFQQIKGRIGQSNFFIGGKYLLLKTDNTFEVPIDIPEFDGLQFSSNLSEASLILNFDSRNNVFTPSGDFLLIYPEPTVIPGLAEMHYMAGFRLIFSAISLPEKICW